MNGLYLLIPTFFILLLTMPVFIEVKGTLNVLNMSGVLSVFVFKKKIQHICYQIKGKTFILQDEGGTNEKEVAFDSQEVILYEEFVKQIKNKTRLKELFVFYNIGLSDAFLSAIKNWTTWDPVSTIKNKKPTASLGVYDTVSYNKEVFEISVKGKVSISLFDVVYSFVNSVILSKKRANNKI